MTEHCHLLGTAGTGAHPGTATGAGTTTGHPWLSRTPLPAVTLQGDERRALSDGPRGGGGWGGDRREGGCAWRVTDGRVAVPAERLRGLCSAPAQCLASPQLEGRPWAFQPQEKHLKTTPKHPGAMGRRTGCLSLLGTAGTPSQPRCPARHRGKLRHAHSEPEERWRHKSLCSPLHSFRLSQTCPHCPLSLPALGKSPWSQWRLSCASSTPAPAGWSHPSCPAASPQCHGLRRQLLHPPGTELTLESGTFGFSSCGFLFFIARFLPLLWPRGLSCPQGCHSPPWPPQRPGSVPSSPQPQSERRGALPGWWFCCLLPSPCLGKPWPKPHCSPSAVVPCLASSAGAGGPPNPCPPH